MNELQERIREDEAWQDRMDRLANSPERPPCEPCETVKRQARRIRELMDGTEALGKVAGDMYAVMRGMERDLPLSVVEGFRERLSDLGIEVGDGE